MQNVESKCYQIFESELGMLLLAEDGKGISDLNFLDDRKDAGEILKTGREEETPLLAEGRKQLEEYFRGERKEFTLPLSLKGTEFQKLCWEALCTIPYGSTCSYGELARKIGRPKACRAVGMANHRNPVGIIVPCHRVIGADGSLTGYGGGMERKEWLLNLEKRG
ncbi:MAG: methylated-DNA--[protein]-cysteine S-methyltransferase [Eubacteriales bacterium]|nr:methylated-DNA--[protein]-cysteine S-methyltransferase [Eubacteriales bacterium]